MPTIVDNSELRGGTGSLRSRKGVPVYEETLHFLVQADYKTQSRPEILRTSGLPVPGNVYGVAACISLTTDRREDNPLYWDVTAQLSSEVDEGSGGENPTDPNTDPQAWVPIYETKYERYQELVTKDQSGAAIANSAGQPFETGLTVTRHIPVWEFFQFEAATVTDETVIARSEVVNNATFKGRAAKTLLCVVLSSVIGFFYGQRRRLTQYQLKYNSKDWTHKRLDVGTQYKSGTTLLDFTSLDGTVLLGSLDGSGGKQAAGTAPAVRSFDQYATSDFSFLRT